MEDLARRLLHDSATAGSDRSTLAELTHVAWSRLAERLSPAIGTAGFYELQRRSLDELSARYPVLAGLPAGVAGEAGAAVHRSRLEGELTEEAVIASLSTFLESLERLIGSDLVRQLVGAAATRSE